ncbi:MAG: hypothetical protein NWE96_11145 [Candidatus Bathyarchaeota archaeon]|nr:hypothetical protein [Candidatus Bathyarchaeota archaeon]
MQTTSDSPKNPSEQSSQSRVQAQKQLVEQLKTQWKLLWEERFDDKLKAEGISTNDYTPLFIEQGTVIHATKDFKPLSFKEILEQHMVENPERYIPPPVEEGGWHKFIKTEVTGKKTKKANPRPKIEKPKGQNKKKGGRGWLHSV